MVAEPLMLARHVLRRLAQAIPLLLGASLLTFLLIHAAPGDPFTARAVQALNQRGRPADFALPEAGRGLDRPLHVQYLTWLGRAARGDLGDSIHTGRPVAEMIGEAVWPSLELTLAAAALAMMGALAAGLIAACRPNGILDRAANAAACLVLSMPTFLWAFLLVTLFSVRLGSLPSAGYASPDAPFSPADHLRHLILPAVTLGLPLAAAWSRYAREGVLDTLPRDYLRAARARGATPAMLARHILPNAVMPLATAVAVELPQLLTGAVIIETIYAWPGLGRLMLTAVLGRDYPVVMGMLLLTAAAVLAGNLAADLLHAALDPRVKYE